MNKISELEQAFTNATDFDTKVSILNQIREIRIQEAQEVIRATYKEATK